MNSITTQRLCAWSGAVGIVLFFLAFALADFIPPPSPSWTQAQVAAHYLEHANGIRAGMVIMIISGMFVPPLIGVISAQIKRMKGVSVALNYAQISAGTVGAVFFFIAPLMFVVTAFRPDRPPELTYLMNDMCWIMMILPWTPAFIQNIVIAAAILCDKSARPVFPRWVAYFNIWVSLAYLPGGLLPFFKHGVFAWSGLMVIWLAATVFLAWFVVMIVMVLKAIRSEENEALSAQ